MASHTKTFATTDETGTATDLPPQGTQCDLVFESHRMPMENAAAQFSEMKNRLHDLLAIAESGRLAANS